MSASAASSAASSAWRTVVAGYERALSRHPLGLTCALGFVIAGTGDVVCQRFVDSPRAPYDAQRTLEMGVVRVLLAPLLFVYFPALSRAVPGSSWPRVLTRVAIDQTIAAPVSIAVIFFASSAVKGRPLEAPQRLREQLLPTWWWGAHFWPFVHVLNFRFVPPRSQAMVAHVASVWWNVVISSSVNKELPSQGSTGDLEGSVDGAGVEGGVGGGGGNGGLALISATGATAAGAAR